MNMGHTRINVVVLREMVEFMRLSGYLGFVNINLKTPMWMIGGEHGLPSA